MDDNSDALLLLISKAEAVQEAVDCYAGLGCFPNTSPWFSLLRPFPKPMKLREIDTKVYLYTR